MGWGKAGKPTHKICPGYGRGPHRVRYGNFPTVRVKHSNGKVGTYAGFLCRDCRNAYTREHKRMTNRLQGKATRPQDVPWRKYRRKQEETWVRGRNSRETRAPSQKFFVWLDKWMEDNDLSIEQLCREVGITSRTLRRWRREGYLQLYNADKILVYAKRPHLFPVLFPQVLNRKAS